jgi:hypothetical protein
MNLSTSEITRQHPTESHKAQRNCQFEPIDNIAIVSDFLSRSEKYDGQCSPFNNFDCSQHTNTVLHGRYSYGRLHLHMDNGIFGHHV